MAYICKRPCPIKRIWHMAPTPFSLGTINQMAFGIARNKLASITKLLLFTDARQNVGKRAAIGNVIKRICRRGHPQS